MRGVVQCEKAVLRARAFARSAEAGAVSARGRSVIDADTGETLFEQNADSRLPIGVHHQDHDRARRARRG